MMLDQNVAALVQTQAGLTPDAIAVIEGRESSVTYRELMARADDVCAFLRARGCQPDELVGIILPRTAEMIATLLGILKAGCAYVPVDPDDPPLRQQRILATAGARLLITRPAIQAAIHATLSEGGQPFDARMCVDISAISRGLHHPPIACAPGGNRLAYVLFTSGSTGDPKGVEIEHRSVVNLLHACRGLFDFTAQDCCLAAATIGFDISIVELFLPLITGGRILLRDRACWLTPRILAREILEYGVTVVQTGPSTWAMLLAELPEFPKVRVVISTAEAIHPDLARRLVDCGESAWNLYGPTETTVWSTGFRMSRETLAHHQHTASSVSIGHPLANTDVCIINEAGQPVPPGTAGELCIGGLGLARGYRNQPALTAARFTDIGTEGRRFYRTGDLVAWSDDGNLLYHGRLDDQLKIRGHRIEPGEIEAALLRNAGVRQAAITWFDAPSGSRSILAAVVPAPGATLTARGLRDELAQHLPESLQPSRYVICSTLPLTPAGKIDRAALRARPVSDVAHEPGMQPDRTGTERTLARIWQDVLHMPEPDRNAHFFASGGDSLAAVRMLCQVEAKFGVELPARAVFNAPTLHELALVIDRTLRPPGAARARWQTTLRNLFRRHRDSGVTVPTPAPFPATPPEMLARQRQYVASWTGVRRRADALVVTLNADGPLPGLFWCLQGFRELSQLARHLGPRQPVHGMRSGYLLMDYQKRDIVDALTQIYADEIHALQPEHPLLLGGNCQGGLVMQGVAERLIARGREVRLLIRMEFGQEQTSYPGRVALIFGRESHLNPYRTPGADPDLAFRRCFPAGYSVDFIDGAHGGFFESPNVESLASVLRERLAENQLAVR